MRIVINTALHVFFFLCTFTKLFIIFFSIFCTSILRWFACFAKGNGEVWRPLSVSECHLSSRLIKRMGGQRTLINIICSNLQAEFLFVHLPGFFFFFGQRLYLIPVSRHPLPAIKHCYSDRKKKLFSFFASLFFPFAGNVEKSLVVTFLREVF